MDTSESMDLIRIMESLKKIRGNEMVEKKMLGTAIQDVVYIRNH